MVVFRDCLMVWMGWLVLGHLARAFWSWQNAFFTWYRKKYILMCIRRLHHSHNSFSISLSLSSCLRDTWRLQVLKVFITFLFIWIGFVSLMLRITTLISSTLNCSRWLTWCKISRKRNSSNGCVFLSAAEESWNYVVGIMWFISAILI